MKNIILNNWLPILISAAFFVYAGVLVYKRKWDQLRGTAYRLILAAEQVITGTRQGQKRFEQVFGQLYCLIPVWIRFWFPEELVREKLQEWYLELKDYLDDGKINNEKGKQILERQQLE